jgi:hypothetical protein
VHLNLSDNQIGPDGAERLAGVLAQCPALAHLDLCGNQIGPTGADSLAGVLGQCAALSHLDLSCNDMGSNPPRNRSGGAEKLAGVLGQCTALAHLDISWNQIGDRDGQKLARVITECPALTYLNLRGNCFTSPPTRGRLRALWCGESCGDLFYKGKMEQKQMERDLEALKKLGRERGWSSAKKPADGSSKKKVANNANRIMTFEEKRTMSLNINKSPHDKLGKVVEIIKKRRSNVVGNSEEIEIDIDLLDNITLRELDKYVRDCLNPSKPKASDPSKAAALKSAVSQVVGAVGSVAGTGTPGGIKLSDSEDSESSDTDADD